MFAKKKKALFPGRGAKIPKSAARSDRLPGIRPQWGSCRDPVRAGAFGVGRVFPPLGVKPHPGPEPIPKSGFAARGSRRERAPSRAIRARRPGRLPPHTSLPSPKMASVFLLSLHKLWCFLCGRRFGSGAKWPVPARGSPHGTPPWPLSVSYLRSSLVSPHNKASLSLASLRERSIVPGRLSERGKALLVSRWLRMQSRKPGKHCPRDWNFSAKISDEPGLGSWSPPPRAVEIPC